MRRHLDEVERLAGRRLCRPASLIVLCLTVVWALGVANLTLFVASGEGPRNAIPFHTIWGYLSDANAPLQIRVRNLAGNLAMLAPLGIALGAVTRWTVTRVGAALIAVSSSIELWQLLVATGRSVDIDDVILNVAGGIIGWIVGLLVLRAAELLVPSVVAPHEHHV